MTDKATTDDLFRKGRRLYELRRTRDLDKKRSEVSEREYREYEQEFYQALDDSPHLGALSMDVGDGVVVKFTPRETYYGRVLDSDAATEYFRGRAMDGEMLEDRISGARLNELVRNNRENGQSPPPGCDFYARRGVSISVQK